MVNTAERADVLILGGGLFGCALAFHLSRLRAGSIVLLDRSLPHIAATGRSAGILTFQGWNRWDAALVRESATQYKILSEATGKGDFRETGGLRVVRTEEGVRWLEIARKTLQSVGIEATSLSTSDVVSRTPGWDLDDVAMGLYTPGDAIFDPVEIAAQYVRLAGHNGAHMLWGREASQIRIADSGWEVEDERGGRFQAANLVLACGAWTKGILTGLGYHLPIAPFRTQAAVLRPYPLGDAFPTFHDTDLDIYLRHNHDGRVLVGNGTGPREVDPELASPEADGEFIDRVSLKVKSLVPAYGRLSVERSWAGVCVASPDGLPVVGRVPGADHLYVATGFNGFGVMRATALARLLAIGLDSDRWDALAPADPARFHPDSVTPPPRPVFSIRDDCSVASDNGYAMLEGAPEQFSGPPSSIDYSKILSAEEVDELVLPSLSDWFDPFLPIFMRDSRRGGGEVLLATNEDGVIIGIYLTNPAERTASMFTRVRLVAEHFFSLKSKAEVYAEREWMSGGDRINVMLAELKDWNPNVVLRNQVRIAVSADMSRVGALIEEVQGPFDRSWLESLPRSDELCFVTEVDGHIVGVSWLTIAGRHARGHSFAVHPRYRGIGIGTDMLIARMLWLKSRGATSVVSEIYGGNEASRLAAERAGMAQVGNMFAFHRT